MLANEYQKLASRTIVDLGEDAFKKHLRNGATGMTIESSEVLQCIQRNEFCGKPLDTRHIVDECGDVLWYISYLLTTLNVSLEECMKCNIEKVEERYKDRVAKCSQKV